MDSYILTINVGSSSIKCSLFERQILAPSSTHKSLTNNTELKFLWDKSAAYEKNDLENIDQTISQLFRSSNIAAEQVNFVGHRIVHGGNKYFTATAVDDSVLKDLYSLVELAPQHQPANIKGIEATRKLFAQAKQIACFDTAYFHDLPQEAQIYAVPDSWYNELGIRRFGFHGISHQYAAQQISLLLNKPLSELKIITCHLGSGSSLAAIKNGNPIMNTMGFTPMPGLIMRTRCGDIDSGIIFYLINQGKFSPSQLDTILNYESGLKGISQLSGDMHELEIESNKGNDKATLAINCYLQNLSRQAGSLLPLLQGLDALVFTGGIGENSSLIRKKLCQSLSFLGLELNHTNNNCLPPDQDDAIISTLKSKVKVAVVKCREDISIANQCQ